MIDSRPFEVTTLREDVETFGRHANVRFGRDWRKDAERRDFTMNALSATAAGAVHDTVGGLDDLKMRRVRFIGEPAARIAEDYLRILRFFRFHAAYGHGAPDRAGVQACIAGRAGLAQLSRERVRMETLKLLLAKYAGAALATMSDAGLLLQVLGGVADLAAFERMVNIDAAQRRSPDPVRRLGALAVRIPEDADRLQQRLRLSNVEHERLQSMGEGWRRISPARERDARVQLYRVGTAALSRPRADGLGAFARRRMGQRLGRALRAAGALDRAGVSDQGGRVHRPRRAARSGARCRAAAR